MWKTIFQVAAIVLLAAVEVISTVEKGRRL